MLARHTAGPDLTHEERSWNLDVPEDLREAARYLVTQMRRAHQVPGESEYVDRNPNMGDRRLSFADQRLARAVIDIMFEEWDESDT